MDEILVTGGSGFVGKHLVSFLSEKGYDVVVLSRRPLQHGGRKEGNIKVIKCDLLDRGNVEKAVSGVSLIVHLAADRKNTNDINRQAMRNLVSAARKNKVEGLIHVSTINVRQKHRDIYAQSKLDAEKILIQSGIKYVILRPTLIYDSKAGNDLNLFVKLVKLLPIIPSLPKNSSRMQPLFIDDLVNILHILIKDRKYWKLRIVEVGGPDILSMPEVLESFARRLSLKRLIVQIPRFMIITCAYVLAVIGKKRAILGMLEDKTTDVSSVKKIFGFKPAAFHEKIRTIDI